ncbi:ATP synthase-coupling factor 6, mitochondrial [Pseudophryne corroboree]|uniref:ATP synthase-coupling factor 6, mitochondrial n=1 Tax=Pseudophryne corroboree TaxID=495146 RepID=UPI003081D6A8
MVLQHLFRFSSVFRSAVSVHLRRNIGLTAIAFNKTKDLDPVQKLFVDKIKEYRAKSLQTGGTVDATPASQKELSEDIGKLQRLFGSGNMNQFPEFKFEEPNLEDVQK